MRQLHPLAWLVLTGSLTFVVVYAANVLVTALVLLCAAVISGVREGPRAAAFGVSFRLGLFLGAVIMLIGVVIGPDSEQASVLFATPAFQLGAGSDFGGWYTSYRFAANLSQATTVVACCALAGLAGQSSPAGQWCDLAEAAIGRGAQLLAPLLCLGEAAARTKQAGHRWWQLGPAIVDQDLAIVASWRLHRGRPRPPSVAVSLASTIGVILVVFVVLGVSLVNGVRLAGEVTVSPEAVLLASFGAWTLARLVLRRGRLVPRVRMPDLLACLSALVPLIALLVSPITGDAAHFETPHDVWPTPPLVTLAGVVICAAAVAALQATARGSAPRRTRAGARA